MEELLRTAACVLDDPGSQFPQSGEGEREVVAWCRCKCSGAQATAKPDQKSGRTNQTPLAMALCKLPGPVSLSLCPGAGEVVVLLVLSTAVLCPGPGEGPVRWAGQGWLGLAGPVTGKVTGLDCEHRPRVTLPHTDTAGLLAGGRQAGRQWRLAVDRAFLPLVFSDRGRPCQSKWVLEDRMTAVVQQLGALQPRHAVIGCFLRALLLLLSQMR
ncbi:hypothetical protein CABS01_04290 [Colletotrichum abscissum]|nr:uncharacterized protein CABS01_04290 [Colletotrichum abscissum]KAK1473628.1 hypothetical protein CABS01_04290 [Colletotrichum abscissum]